MKDLYKHDPDGVMAVVTSLREKTSGYNDIVTKLNNLVTSIGDSVFANCSNLALIKIPASVKTIGDNAFFRCTSLTTVTFQNGLITVFGIPCT